MKNIASLCGHPIVLLREDPEGEIIGYLRPDGRTPLQKTFSVVQEFAPVSQDQVARASQTEEDFGGLDIDGTTVPLVKMTYSNPIGLPDHSEGTFFIVSAITANAAKTSGRDTSDLLIVTGRVTEDAEGKITLGAIKFGVV